MHWLAMHERTWHNNALKTFFFILVETKGYVEENYNLRRSPLKELIPGLVKTVTHDSCPSLLARLCSHGALSSWVAAPESSSGTRQLNSVCGVY